MNPYGRPKVDRNKARRQISISLSEDEYKDFLNSSIEENKTFSGFVRDAVYNYIRRNSDEPEED